MLKTNKLMLANLRADFNQVEMLMILLSILSLNDAGQPPAS